MTVEKAQFPVPDGWLAFGSLVDYNGPSECSEETGEDGLPLWERMLPPCGERCPGECGWKAGDQTDPCNIGLVLRPGEQAPDA